MTKFEQVGINYQYSAESKAQALRAFDHSCHCCCHRGMHIDCDNCAIATVHKMVVATFEQQEVTE